MDAEYIKERIEQYGFVDLFPDDDWYFSLKGAIIYVWYSKNEIKMPLPGLSELPPQEELDNLAKLISERINDGELKTYSYSRMIKTAEGEYIFKRSDLQKVFFPDHETMLEPPLDMFFSNVDFKILIPKPRIQRRSKAVPLVEACIDHYGGTPANYMELINYCIKNPPQGYPEFSKGNGKIYWKGDSVQIRAFKNAFKNAFNAIKGD